MEDTFFIMVTNAFYSWIFALAPIYFFIVNPIISERLPPAYTWFFINIYALMNAITFYLRFKNRMRHLQ